LAVRGAVTKTEVITHIESLFNSEVFNYCFGHIELFRMLR